VLLMISHVTLLPCVHIFCSSSYPHHRDPHSFPTRRSSDLTDDEQQVAIDYLLSETYSDESVQEFLDAGTVPPLDGLDEEVSAADDSGYLSFVYDMIKSAPHFQLSWDQALPPDQAQALLDNLSKIFLGQLTPQQFVDAMNATR